MKRCAEYEDSGVEWAGSIPTVWNAIRVCLLMLLLPIILSACSDNEPTGVSSWQEAYAMVLGDYLSQDDRLYFFLYDFDKDDTPELIVVGEHAGDIVDDAYVLRNGEALPLEYEESVNIANHVFGARSGIGAPPGSAQGLITNVVGSSAGAFGTSVFYQRIVVDEDRLAIDAHGAEYIDYDALHELFDDFGRGATDVAALDAAIKEHTHWMINDIDVSEEDFNLVFYGRGRVKDKSFTRQICVFCVQWDTNAACAAPTQSLRDCEKAWFLQ